MTVSSESKIIAKEAFDVFGGKPIVSKYWDDKKESSIDIILCSDRPYKGVTSYSTIGLSEYNIGYTSEDIPLRVELVGACASHFQDFPNILASCAFNIINTKFACYPGAIFQNVVGFYNANSEMQHVLFTTPFIWEKTLETISFQHKKVTWLLAVPISNEELKYASENSADALEELFEKYQIDIFDLNRKSVR